MAIEAPLRETIAVEPHAPAFVECVTSDQQPTQSHGLWGRRKRRHAAILHELHPDLDKKRQRTKPVVGLVKKGVALQLEDPLIEELLYSWKENYESPYVHRAIEQDVRAAAKEAGRVHGKLKRRKSSSLAKVIEIVSQGEIPTNIDEVQHSIDAETDPDKKATLATLHEVLKRDQEKGKSRNRTTVWEIGESVGCFLAGANAQIGIRNRTDPEGKRRHDPFVATGGRFLTDGLKPIIGKDIWGIEESNSLGVATHTENNPVKGNQRGIHVGPFEFDAGKTNTVKFELPPPLAIAFILSPKYPQLPGMVYAAMGPLAALKPSIARSKSGEGYVAFQEIAAWLSSFFPEIKIIPERAKFWKKGKNTTLNNKE